MSQEHLRLVETIRRKIVVRTSIGIALVALCALLVLAVPLYLQLKEANERDFGFKHKAKTELIDKNIANFKNIAEQITSRTKIRDKLVEYNEGRITLAVLQDFCRELLADAMQKSKDILAIQRADASRKSVITLGFAVPQSLMDSLSVPMNGSKVFEPFSVQNVVVVAVASPIFDKENKEVGVDIVLFDAKSIQKVVNDYESFGKTGEIILGKKTGDKIEGFFAGRNGEKTRSLKASSGEAIFTSPLSSTSWTALSRIDESELNDILNKNITLLVFVVVLLVILGLFGIAKITNPLLNMLENNLKQLRELHAALLDKNKRLREQLFTDSLTGLPNRNALEQDKKTYKTPALAIVNIDRFNEINDFYGSAAGDFVLRGMAEFFVKEVDLFFSTKTYRLGGDDFGVLIKDSMSLSIDDFARFLLEKLEAKVFHFESYDLTIQISIGISKEAPLQEKADLALKLLRKGSISKYTKYLEYHDKLGLYQNIKANFSIIDRLKSALDGGRIVPYFQPIENLSTGKIEKYECLARMIDNDGSVEAPAMFLEAAKRSKLYPKITIAMLEKSFAAFNNSEYGFSVNLSNEDIENSEITDYLLLMFEKFPNLSKRAQVTIEILETEGIVNYPKVYDFTHRLKGLYGCKLAIDDFGAGYSNFTHILQLKVDYLKIDSSLIKEIDKSIEAQAIVRTVVAFSKELGISTIAEFVHSREVYDKVKELGVDYAQGYYVGKPESHTI